MMDQEIRDGIRILAGEALAYFEHRKRDDGTECWILEVGTPEWMKALVWEAHNKGEMLPEDFRYLFIIEALEAITENPEKPESLLEPSVYLGDLLTWLEASTSYRMGLVDEAVSQFGWNGLFEALQAGQMMEKEEVLGIVREFLKKRVEEGEED